MDEETSNSLGRFDVTDIDTLEHTPTWAVGMVCIIIVIASLLLGLGLKTLERYFQRTEQKPLQETLEKMKEDVMLLGFISLMLVITRDSLAKICVPRILADVMLPCSNGDGARALPANATVGTCKPGQIPLMSTESLHQLHMFIFVMAIVHVFYSCMTMILARLQMKRWKRWEDECREQILLDTFKVKRQHSFLADRVDNSWTTAMPTCLSWIDSFMRQFWHPVKRSDYLTLRRGFIKNHNAAPTFNFLTYIMRVMEDDFKTIVGMRAYLWVFVIIFMLLNIHGWYTYFWIVFFPFILLLAVGTKLQHVMTSLALERRTSDGILGEPVKPRDELFWFKKPRVLLHLIHFILFQNSFELAYFSWIWSTYGLHSCFMERRALVYSRVAVGFISQILCSYTTLPLYALVTQMGSSYRKAILPPNLAKSLTAWHRKAKQKNRERAAEEKEKYKWATRKWGKPTTPSAPAAAATPTPSDKDVKLVPLPHEGISIQYSDIENLPTSSRSRSMSTANSAAVIKSEPSEMSSIEATALNEANEEAVARERIVLPGLELSTVQHLQLSVSEEQGEMSRHFTRIYL